MEFEFLNIVWRENWKSRYVIAYLFQGINIIILVIIFGIVIESLASFHYGWQWSSTEKKPENSNFLTVLTKYNGRILNYYIPMTPLWNRRSSRIAQSSVSSWTRIIRNSVSGSANFFWQIAFSTFISSGGNDYFSVIFILFIFWSNQNIIAWRLLWGWWGQTSDTKVIRRFQKSC